LEAINIALGGDCFLGILPRFRGTHS